MRGSFSILSGCLLFALFSNESALAGHVVGNGGDYIRAQFLSMGRQVLLALDQSESGRTLVDQHSLSLAQLSATIEVSQVQVVDTPLVDNSGSLVDAIGEPGRIVLNSHRWLDHFERQRDVYYLVFHEMLRSAGVNDDSYVISRFLKPFPEEFRQDYRIRPQIPLLAVDDPRGLVDLDRAVVLGSGCANPERRYLEFNDSLMALDLALAEMSGTTTDSLTIRKSCGLSLPLRALPKQRIVVTQVDWDARLKLPQGASLDQSLELFVTGRRSPVTRRRFEGVQEGSTLLRRAPLFQTPCGKEALLRLQPSFSLGGGPEALFETRRLRVYLTREAC